MGSLNFLRIHDSTHEKSRQFLSLETKREEFEVYSSFIKGSRWLAEKLCDLAASRAEGWLRTSAELSLNEAKQMKLRDGAPPSAERRKEGGPSR